MGSIEAIKKIEREEDIERDIEKGKRDVIESLITKLELSDKQVADTTEMPVSFVKKVRASLKKKSR